MKIQGLKQKGKTVFQKSADALINANNKLKETRFGRWKYFKVVVAIVTVLAVFLVGAVIHSIRKNKLQKNFGEMMLADDVVLRGDIEVAITGEAAVEPYERYEIISMVSGDIISSPFDVGDEVKKDDIVYQFDTTDAQSSIRKQEISLEQSRNNLSNAKSDLNDAIEKLSLTAPNDGIISDLKLKVGSSVSNNEIIAQITNTSDMEVSFPFTSEQTANIYIGQSAIISSSAHMSSVTGRVVGKSQEPVAREDGSIVYNVDIEFTNPGSFLEGITVGCEIDGMQSPGYGEVKYCESGTLKAQTSGTVTNVYYKNGTYVKKGTVIATLESDSISTQQRSIRNSELNLQNAELNMNDTKEGLLDYSIKSPISGTVITKNAKAGDTIDRTNSSQSLMVIADISKLKFSLEIDELDVSSVKEGQKVDITCDALPNERFEGEITSISVEGTATNGVTTYTADVVINEPKNLRPSMNIDASVIIDSVQDVLMVPAGDVKTIMGTSYVYLKDDGQTKQANEKDFENKFDKNKPSTQNGDGGFNVKKQDNEKAVNNKNKNNQMNRMPEAPDGYIVVVVETGLSNEDYIEIKSGLKEGDQIKQLTQANANQNGIFGMMSAMHSSMSGGMPGANMGGGMPRGNMGTMR